MAFAQNVVAAMVTRSKAQDHIFYNVSASAFASGLWFLSFRILVLQNMSLKLCVPYTVGFVAGRCIRC